jgi:hypothetical protein
MPMSRNLNREDQRYGTFRRGDSGGKELQIADRPPGVGSQDRVIVVATANDPTCLDAAIPKRPGSPKGLFRSGRKCMIRLGGKSGSGVVSPVYLLITRCWA